MSQAVDGWSKQVQIGGRANRCGVQGWIQGGGSGGSNPPFLNVIFNYRPATSQALL